MSLLDNPNLELTEHKLSFREKIRLWWHSRILGPIFKRGEFAQWYQEHDCDGCDGTFELHALCPVSGDWWLCEACFDRIYPEFNKRKAST